MKTNPDYKLIYSDIIEKKYPEKREICQKILGYKTLCALDILKLNAIIFDDEKKENEIESGKYKSYDKKTILSILEFQKNNNFNNSQIAKYFKMSRNTVAKWKKIFL